MMATSRHDRPVYLRLLPATCKGCRKAIYLRDAVAAPEGEWVCCQNRSGDPDYNRKLEQEKRPALGLAELQRDLFGVPLAPPPWQPLKIGDGRWYLWQVMGVEQVYWKHENRTVWYIDSAGAQGSYSGRISDEEAEVLIALGVPTKGQYYMWSCQKAWDKAKEARRLLGFVQVERPRILIRDEEPDDGGEE